MKIVIPGGSGQVGTMLARAFHKDGHEVVVLSRSSQPAPWRVVAWDGVSVGEWASEIDGADVVINLAGRSVNCRYNQHNRREIMDSRIDSTRAVAKALTRAKTSPRVWLQASTATIYEHRFDKANDERSGIIGGNEPNSPSTWRFSIDVATSWERVTDETPTPGTRVIKMRSAIIMSPDRGGAFDTLLQIVRVGLGGQNSNGRQFVSWIHEQDFVRAVRWLIEHDVFEGPVNISAPNPLPNAAFMRDLRRAWGIPIGLPATKLMLEVGAWALGTETELLLKSRRVVPTLLLESGFTFDYPTWSEAARDLCRQWRENNTAKGA